MAQRPSSNSRTRSASTRTTPSRRPERSLARSLGGNVPIAGVDEAGRGPLAGPVVAAAVIWPDKRRPPRGLNDSKQVDPKSRVRIFHQILHEAQSIGVGLASPREIDAINIYQATRLAARRALDALSVEPAGAVTDYLTLPGYPHPVEALVSGDCKSVSIAAASIVAKVIRDRLMEHYAEEYPGYLWESNRGYPTPDHQAALDRLGPTTLHRLTFAGVGFFSDRLRPSRTLQRFLRDREAGDQLRRRYRTLSRLDLSWNVGQWAALSPSPDVHPHPAIPLLALEWEGFQTDEQRISFLVDQERDALDAFLTRNIRTPPWWPESL